MTHRRSLILAALATAGTSTLAAAPASAVTTTRPPALTVTRITYDHSRRHYVGHGTYGRTPVRVRYVYSPRHGRWIALVEATDVERCDESTIKPTGQWTCFNGCRYPVYLLECGFVEEGGSGSFVRP